MKLRKPKHQWEKVIVMILQSKKVTNLEIRLKHWIMNSPNCIFRARQNGYDIHTDMVERGKTKVAQYSFVDYDEALKKYDPNYSI